MWAEIQFKSKRTKGTPDNQGEILIKNQDPTMPRTKIQQKMYVDFNYCKHFFFFFNFARSLYFAKCFPRKNWFAIKRLYWTPKLPETYEYWFAARNICDDKTRHSKPQKKCPHVNQSWLLLKQIWWYLLLYISPIVNTKSTYDFSLYIKFNLYLWFM